MVVLPVTPASVTDCHQIRAHQPLLFAGVTGCLDAEQGLLMAEPKNERNTENIVRADLRRLGYYRAASKIIVEEQKSQIESVRRLMKAASKSGHGGIGSPEFIISCAGSPD